VLVGTLLRLISNPSWLEIAFLASATPRPPKTILNDEARSSSSIAFLNVR